VALLVTVLDAEERAVIAAVWAFRARSERQATLRFTRLARELREVGAEASVIALAETAVVHEEAHERICLDVARAYGHTVDEPAAEGDDDAEAPAIGPRRLSMRDRVLYEMIAFCCITESLNASLMMLSYERAREPDVRAALRVILRDEVSHSRMGWMHLAAERAQGRGAFVAKALPYMLAGTVREELFARGTLGDEARETRLGDHGELSETIRLELFEHTLEDVIYPGLEALGIDTGPARAWVASMRTDSLRRAG
jgi:hypothetical protein